MTTKHFITKPFDLVAGSLKALSITNPSVRIDDENKVAYLPQGLRDDRHVTLLSGGGSGHEPSFGGFVGEGLLTGAVAGTIFASPSSRQVLAALDHLVCSQGSLVTVMNYTGDVLNFGVAIEKAKAKQPGRRIEMLIVGDDVAVPRKQYGKVGRRGVAGTVLVQKIVGAMAADGYGLDDIIRTGKLICANLVSIGVSLDRVHVPGIDTEVFRKEIMLADDEVELGMGIHNEQGCSRRRGAQATLSPLVKDMLSQLLDPEDPERGYLQGQIEEAVLLVNNLGGLSPLELGAAATEVTSQLTRTYSIRPVRVYADTYMTSLDGRGFSVSLLRCMPTGLPKTVVQFLDRQVQATGWKSQLSPDIWLQSSSVRAHSTNAREYQPLLPPPDSNIDGAMDSILIHLHCGLAAIIRAEPEVTKYDSIVGDGDCGTTLKRGAESK